MRWAKLLEALPGEPGSVCCGGSLFLSLSRPLVFYASTEGDAGYLGKTGMDGVGVNGGRRYWKHVVPEYSTRADVRVV